MTIGTVFKFLKILGGCEAKNWKELPQTRSVRKEAFPSPRLVAISRQETLFGYITNKWLEYADIN